MESLPATELVNANVRVYLTDETWVILPMKYVQEFEAYRWMEASPPMFIDRGEMVLLAGALAMARRARADRTTSPWDKASVVNASRRLFSIEWYDKTVTAVMYSAITTSGFRWARVSTQEWLDASDMQIARYLSEQAVRVGPRPTFERPRQPQRRAHYRVSLQLPLQFYPVQEDGQAMPPYLVELDHELDQRGLPGEMEDLSTGGLRMSVASPLKPGDLVYVGLSLWNQRLVAMGQVRRSIPAERQHWRVGVQFIGLDPAYQGRIAQYLFNEQSRSAYGVAV